MPNFDFEISFGKKNKVIGVDEVGRGPLAGPVVSCACIYLDYKINESFLSLINDSKKISAKKRLEIFKKINFIKKKGKLNYKIGFASVEEIDKYNILEATKISMKRAIEKFNYNSPNLIIDGKIGFDKTNKKIKEIINGDKKSYSIASASIIAKVIRDRYMSILGMKYPVYKWGKNVGYGTQQHIHEIYKNGITSHHRKSFEPIKSLIHKK